MTVMSWGNRDGVKGRCDAKCHTARSTTCDCMCGGVYHGSVRLGRFELIHRTECARVLADAKRRAARLGFELIAGPGFTGAMPSLFDEGGR